MSKIIFNEQKVLDDILINKQCYIEEYKAIQILIKYFYLQDRYDKLGIREKTIEALSDTSIDFLRANWIDYIDKSIEKLLKNVRVFGNLPKILDVKKVNIYKEELDYIDSFKYSQQRKILFTLLVYSKIYNKMLNSDEGWITENFSDILKEAKCKTGNNQYRLELLKELKDLDTINVFYKNGNCHIKVNYIKEEGDKLLEVSDFDNIIYYYLIHKGEKWKQCSECGKYFKSKSKKNNAKYCNKCSKVIHQKQKNISKNNL